MGSEREDWRAGAACAHADPELFFADGTTGPALRQVDEAKQVCRMCRVCTPCLTWALPGCRRRRVGRNHRGGAARHPAGQPRCREMMT